MNQGTEGCLFRRNDALFLSSEPKDKAEVRSSSSKSYSAARPEMADPPKQPLPMPPTITSNNNNNPNNNNNNNNNKKKTQKEIAQEELHEATKNADLATIQQLVRIIIII